MPWLSGTLAPPPVWPLEGPVVPSSRHAVHSNTLVANDYIGPVLDRGQVMNRPPPPSAQRTAVVLTKADRAAPIRCPVYAHFHSTLGLCVPNSQARCWPVLLAYLRIVSARRRRPAWQNSQSPRRHSSLASGQQIFRRLSGSMAPTLAVRLGLRLLVPGSGYRVPPRRRAVPAYRLARRTTPGRWASRAGGGRAGSSRGAPVLASAGR